MNKMLCRSQNMEVKTLPADVCIFCCFAWLSPAVVHPADSRFDSRVKWWIHISSIVTSLLLFVALKQLQTTLNRRRVVFDRLWANTAPTLNTAFSLKNVHAKGWIHSLLISLTLLLSHATSIYNQPKRVKNFCVFQDNCQIWANRVFSISCVCMTAFKVSIPPLNHCFWQSRVRITLKPLLYLISIPSPQKPMLYQHTNFRFSHCFENLQQ